MSKFKIGDKVKHPCDSSAFEVVGVREAEIEIKGIGPAGHNRAIRLDGFRPKQ